MAADPSFIAAADQRIAEARELARIVRAYYDNLVLQGFDAAEALVLSVAYQGAFFDDGDGTGT